MQNVLIAFNKLTVRVDVQNKAESIYMGRKFKGIGYSFVCFAEVAVVFFPDSVIYAVDQIGTVSVATGQFCLETQR